MTNLSNSELKVLAVVLAMDWGVGKGISWKIDGVDILELYKKIGGMIHD